MDVKATPYSNLKIFHHGDLLKKIEQGKRVSPLYVRIKPTNICNQNCYYCHYKNSYLALDDYNASDFISCEKMLETIADFKSIGVKSVTFSGGGEPLVYPYIDKAIESLLDAKIEVSIITNGMLLKNKSAELLTQAKWVRISADAADDDLYCKLRGVKKGSFDVLCDNIEKFSKLKQPYCELGINFVVGQKNYQSVYDMAKLMKKLGANHIKFAPLINNETEKYHEDLISCVTDQLTQTKQELQDDKFRVVDLYTSDFERVENGTLIFDRAYNNCYIKDFICVIGANSKVYYCHDKAYLKDGLVADLKDTSFKEAWFSGVVTDKFRNFNAKKTCNQHCVYDDRNILLNTYFSLDKNHINFI